MNKIVSSKQIWANEIVWPAVGVVNGVRSGARRNAVCCGGQLSHFDRVSPYMVIIL